MSDEMRREIREIREALRKATNLMAIALGRMQALESMLPPIDDSDQDEPSDSFDEPLGDDDA